MAYAHAHAGAWTLMAVAGATTLPTMLPTTGTTVVSHGQGGYTGTIPTEFGLLTKVTELDLNLNYLSGTIPTHTARLLRWSELWA